MSDSTLYLKDGGRSRQYLTNEQMRDVASTNDCRIQFFGSGVTSTWIENFGPQADTLLGTINGRDTTPYIVWAGNDFDKQTVA